MLPTVSGAKDDPVFNCNNPKALQCACGDPKTLMSRSLLMMMYFCPPATLRVHAAAEACMPDALRTMGHVCLSRASSSAWC